MGSLSRLLGKNKQGVNLLSTAAITLELLLATLCVGAIYTLLLLHHTWFRVNRNSSEIRLAKQFYERLPLIILNIFLLCLFSYFGIGLADGLISRMHTPMWIFCVQFMIFIFLDDFGFYLWHRYLHTNKILLRHVHRIHHRARNPLPLEFIYVHPLEWMGGTVGLLVAFMLVVGFFGSLSCYVLWGYLIFRTMHELDIHSCLRPKWLERVFFFAGANYHHNHHKYARGNYASTFSYLDKLFKTRLPVDDYPEKVIEGDKTLAES